MKNLYIKEDNQLMVERIMKLSPDLKPLWGKMNVSAMLYHCTQPIRCGLGELKLKRSLIGILFGGIAKKQMLSEKPIKKGLPTDKNYLPGQSHEFQKERDQLIEKVKLLVQKGPEGVTKDVHPFFGKLTPEEWNHLTWKHLDHHLSQFGV